MDRHTQELRVRDVNRSEVRPGGDFVLYWMVANRRRNWNFALQRAVDRAASLDRPLVVLEPLRCGYRWASDRLHRFVLEGMRDNRADFAQTPALYYPYVELEEGAGSGLVEALAERACVVVTDDYPCFFLPRMLAATARRLEVRVEAVDSNGILPMRAADRTFTTAHSFRAFLQRELEPHLRDTPKHDPFERRKLPELHELPAELTRRWPEASSALLEGGGEALSSLSIDHSVGPGAVRGGARAGAEALQNFLAGSLDRYGQERNHPDEDGASGLSPYLHFGHVSAHAVLRAVADKESWSPDEIRGSQGGARKGWWQMSESAEAFLDQLVTWRELGFNSCSRRSDYDQYESLPEWAQNTLSEHADDDRPVTYTASELEQATTHDDLWNAAQTQLVTEGRMHNYLRMLWGKKILEWTPTPRAALEIMIELNDKYALDGRDPNSYSGIFWVLGRYDRAWGPERPIYGKIRYMSSDNTRKKLHVKEYLERYLRSARDPLARSSAR